MRANVTAQSPFLSSSLTGKHLAPPSTTFITNLPPSLPSLSSLIGHFYYTESGRPAHHLVYLWFAVNNSLPFGKFPKEGFSRLSWFKTIENGEVMRVGEKRFVKIIIFLSNNCHYTILHVRNAACLIPRHKKLFPTFLLSLVREKNYIPKICVILGAITMNFFRFFKDGIF